MIFLICIIAHSSKCTGLLIAGNIYAGRFVEERTRPGLDLIHRIKFHVDDKKIHLKTIADLGTGRFIPHLLHTFPESNVIGIDSSDQMLTSAKIELAKTLPSHVLQRVSLENASINDWNYADGIECIFSNAALHWLKDHDTLYPNKCDLMEELLPSRLQTTFQNPHTCYLTKYAGLWKTMEKFQQARL